MRWTNGELPAGYVFAEDGAVELELDSSVDWAFEELGELAYSSAA